MGTASCIVFGELAHLVVINQNGIGKLTIPLPGVESDLAVDPQWWNVLSERF